jgi:o-succinylbenzoate synthase
MLQASYSKKVFQFAFKARTSRGLMRDKISWFIKLWDDATPDVVGIGECGPLPGLSPDAIPNFEEELSAVINNLNQLQHASAPTLQHLYEITSPHFPSIIFGLETALLDLQHGGKRLIYENEFTSGKQMPINGLVWMGDLDFMMNQINQKIAQGFNCIKLKVGGLDFDRECDILQYIRKRYFKNDIIIRLDANGAFKIDDVLYKLSELSKYNIESIEQPIKPGMIQMEELCRKSPIPIAFDEELIGKASSNEKKELLTRLKPKYIILKPTLHGGFKGCAEWINIATSLNIGWWITSALESNIGLNAICQFASQFDIKLHQGLGTGMIYTNNIESPLRVEKGMIFYDTSSSWNNVNDL